MTTALLLTVSLLGAAPEPVDFLFDVRPILSEHCYACHGPDDKARKAGLRLDQPAAFRKNLDSGIPLIEAGAPEDSELMRRLITTDEAELMPPASVKNPLSPAQIDIIRRWLAQGAPLPEKSHWAFNTIGQVAVPPARGSDDRRNPIDNFVREKLHRKGLSPSAPATRETLLRRLSLDLTGLPATADEIDRFRNDIAPDAYEREVERLLASPRFGERLANDWVDLARYADTYGYQSDVDRDMSPWRDWVINAFNANLPYDQFINWQVAGDLLPNPTREQYLATAFNRLHRQTNEGGSIEEEFRTEYVADRVHTFGTAFLGLTLECSRCHDHKYDPIRQRDYYGLFAFFNNIDESGLYSHFTRATPTPTLLLYRGDDEQRHVELRAKLRELESRYQTVRAAAQSRVTVADVLSELPPPALSPQSHFAFDAEPGGPALNSADKDKPATLVEDPQVVEGRFGQALQFNGDNSVQLKGLGLFKRTDPFSFSLWLRPTEKQERGVVLHRSRAWTDSGSRGYELVLDQGRPSFALIHFYPGNALHVRAREEISLNAWTHLAVTYDGSSRAAGLAMYLNGRKLDLEVVRDHLTRDILHRGEWGDDTGGVELTLAGRFRDSGFRNGLIDELSIFDRALTSIEVRSLTLKGSDTPLVPTVVERIDYQVETRDPQLAAARAELKQVRDQENDLVGNVREIMVMNELPDRRPTFVLRRGVYNQPGEAVDPTPPEGILEFPAELPRNRAGLARWLTDHRNPLTARVVVNRIWRIHFGRGIVATQEDFGNQGQLPTHPELLDWLSARLIQSGWDLKDLHRLIVNSATYRQSSVPSPEALATDPENLWLSRGPKHRLSAEQIRDSALAISGLLSGQIGGPSAKPYQPAGLWEESGTGKTYVQDHGENLYRRSLYTFWRRTAPPPTMLTFDATSREVCTAKRETTATPLQSLVLLNDPQILEAARVLAQALMSQTELTPPQRIGRAFLMATGRSATPGELEVLQRLHDEQKAWFDSNPGEAEKYLASGEYPRNAALPAHELSALAVTVHACLNHDEFVMER